MTADSNPIDTPPLRWRRLRALAGPARTLFDAVVTPTGFWAALAVYLLVHFLLRWWTSPNIGTDEVEQALFAQAWDWGYNPRQPPLFTWLLLSAYALVGPSLLAHLLVKYVALAAMYAAAYRCARRLLAEPALAALATMALVLIYGFGWGVHTGVTHTLTMAALIFATLLALLRLVEHRRVLDYGLFGAATGVGLLTKYSFGMFIVPLLIAALLVGETRPALRDRRMLVAIGVAALIFLPHGIWMLTSGSPYGATLAELGAVGARPSWGENVVTGLGSLAQASALFLAPLWVIVLALFWPQWRHRGGASSAWARVLLLSVAIAFAALVLTVLIGQVTYFKDRRMHAVLLIAPLVAFMALDRRPLAGGVQDWRRLRWLGAAISVVVALVLVMLLGQALLEPYACRRCWLHMPLPAFEQAIRDAGFAHGTIVAAEEHVGGNLRLAFPEARVLTPAYPTLDPPARDAAGHCLLAWHARLMGDAVPPSLAAFVGGRFKLEPAGAPVALELPMLRRAGRTDRFAYLIVTNADGACRPT
ncbi:MAG: glycosyltransferase family 39 protein [Alphaproteobacteria bacterium]|nr:glycosyltransferase family 39 protein [Alphaproteobacteria bacterium]